MDRLNRAQAQARNRERVLDAARAEFRDQGYRDAKIDGIAARAGLTRGAVYSNFPGKQALYLEVLADRAARATGSPMATVGDTLRSAVGGFARAWVVDPAVSPLVSEIIDDQAVLLPYARLLKLTGLLLAAAMEELDRPQSPPGAPPARRVRQAQAILTVLHGASHLEASGFVEAFDVVSACEQLADLAINDWWAYPYSTAAARQVDEPWRATEAVDLVTGEAASIGDGVVAILGTHRVMAVEEVLRLGLPATVVVVTNRPEELHPLVRLVVTEVAVCLRQSFAVLPALRVVCDNSIAAAAGLTAVSDATEAAVRVAGGRVVVRADGVGACHAVCAPEFVNS
ncbi:TetR/AcrR family transcriptional regulator [Actinokineospora inagensis]|uniref:TetR/AcrR family transcriptional regulator n=1 Tax=Actinokineospora inagensis TaxID=103730 RepID=UPI00047AB751|nr:TetR/AcrR family transcriptional regulator [Actinokineospora inagensis]